MTFYLDKKFASNHYALVSLFFLLFGIILIILEFKFYEITSIFMFLGIVFICVAVILLALNFYSNLTLIGRGFVIERKEAYGDPTQYPHTMKSNAYMYKIINLNNISITKRYITLTEIFEKESQLIEEINKFKNK